MNNSFGRVSLSLLFAAALLGACATMPPGADYPKTPSLAYDQPEATQLGRKFADAARAHPGKSGLRLLAVGVDGFLARAQMINAAERTIDLQYFIFRSDDSGSLLAEALLRAADRGVRVRLLIDDGDTAAGDEKLSALEAHPKIEVRIFNPFAYRGHLDVFRAAEFMFNKPRLDYRMHNKLMVVDNAMALIGGRNVADDYFQIDPELQYGDDDVFAVGPVVRRLSATFDDYWNSEPAIPAQALEPESAASLQAYRRELADHHQALKEQGLDYVRRIASGEPLATMVSGALPLVWADAKVICDSPEKARIEKGEIIGQLMHRSVAETVAAVRSELLMVSPYLIPGAEGMQLFRELRKRGVSVRILTNSLVSANVLAAHAGYMHYRVPLLESGVELYEVRALLGNAKGSGEPTAMTQFGTYSLHAKWFIFDRKKLFVGSMNFDLRSMHLNTEVGLIIDSPELARQAAARFEAIVQPANSYRVLLRNGPADGPPSLVWRTAEEGRPVEYLEEPAQNAWQKLRVRMLSLLPFDKEL